MRVEFLPSCNLPLTPLHSAALRRGENSTRRECPRPAPTAKVRRPAAAGGILRRMSPRTTRWIAGLVALGLLLMAYLPLLQTIPNGSEHYFMIDVGETQTVLNVWGTLHATGYPLYILLGAPFVALLRALGVGAATAPGLFSLVVMLAALAVVYLLGLRLTERPWISAAATVAFGLTRTVWIHAEIAEIYAFTLLLLVVMLWIAFLPRRPETDGWRLYGLALLGGLSVAHHRALVMAIPALVYAMWPVLTATPRALPRRLLICLALGLLGFLPYLWLPLRAQAGAAWVYGAPGTLDGFLDEFLGREASRFIGPPASADGLLANVQLVVQVLLTDLTLPGLLAGAAGLIAGLWRPAVRRMTIALILLTGAAFAFHALAYTDVLSALILMITLPVALGWALLADAVLSYSPSPPTPSPTQAGRGESANQPSPLIPLPSGEGKSANQPSPLIPLPSGEGSRPLRWAMRLLLVFAFFALLIAALIPANVPFIGSLVEDTTGLETIALARRAPPGSTLMLPWGPRYFAAGFARDVLGMLPGTVQLVDHRADYRAILDSERMLVTPPDTFYNQPLTWWTERAGGPLWLTAAGPGLVEISATPALVAPASGELPVPQDAAVFCRDGWADLRVDWAGPAEAAGDWSVFVHGVDTNGALLAQGDQSAPVFGWRPLSSWVGGEQVRDFYSVLAVPGLSELRYGFYRALPDGGFENAEAYRIAVACGGLS